MSRNRLTKTTVSANLLYVLVGGGIFLLGKTYQPQHTAGPISGWGVGRICREAYNQAFTVFCRI